MGHDEGEDAGKVLLWILTRFYGFCGVFCCFVFVLQNAFCVFEDFTGCFFFAMEAVCFMSIRSLGLVTCLVRTSHHDCCRPNAVFFASLPV